MSKKWEKRGEEPMLEEIMKDPIIGLVMARDNLAHEEVWHVVRQAQDKLCKRSSLQAA